MPAPALRRARPRPAHRGFEGSDAVSPDGRLLTQSVNAPPPIPLCAGKRVRKPGRKALRAGKQRVLADHRTVAGKQYHVYFVALAKAFDLSAPLARLEAS